MKNNNYADKVSKDIKLLESRVNPTTLDKVKKHVATTLLRLGIGVEYALPLIMSFVVIFSILEKRGDAPFRIDRVVDTVHTKEIDTTDGTHLEFNSIDSYEDDENIEYSSAWKINEHGMYERKSIIFSMDKDLDLSDTNKILNMSEEELKNSFQIIDIKKVSKSSLDDLDNIYNTDTVVITKTGDSIGDTIRDETTAENITTSVIYIMGSLLTGIFSGAIFFKLIGDKLKRKAYGCIRSYGPFADSEIAYMKNLLEIKKENLALLTDTYEEDSSKTYRKIRR